MCLVGGPLLPATALVHRARDSRVGPRRIARPAGGHRGDCGSQAAFPYCPACRPWLMQSIWETPMEGPHFHPALDCPQNKPRRNKSCLCISATAGQPAMPPNRCHLIIGSTPGIVTRPACRRSRWRGSSPSEVSLLNASAEMTCRWCAGARPVQ